MTFVEEAAIAAMAAMLSHGGGLPMPEDVAIHAWNYANHLEKARLAQGKVAKTADAKPAKVGKPQAAKSDQPSILVPAPLPVSK
jgi:hypothetical protein